MNWIEKMIAEQCPNGVKYVKLGEVFNVQNGYTPSKSEKSFWENGVIPWFRLEDIRTNGRKLTDAIQHITPSAVKKSGVFKAGSIIISTTATIGEYALVDCDFVCNQQITCLTPLSNNTNSHFFLHYSAFIGEWCRQKVSGVGLAILPTSKLKECLIPLPPPSIQEEIVSVLDKFSELIEKTDAEIALRQKQYEYYREKLLTFENGEVEWKTINKIGQLVRGNGLQKADFREKGTGCIHYGQIYTKLGFSLNKTLSFVSDELANKLTKVEPGDLVIACTSENVEDVCKSVVWLGKETVVTGGHACVFKHNENSKYIGYCFLTHDFFQQKKQYAYGAKVIDIKTEKLGQIKLPIPSLSRQQEIVETLDKFETLISKLKEERELRQKQYEYYREKLLTF